MLTLKDTEIAVKLAEQHIERSDGAGADAEDNVKVAFAAGVDNPTAQDEKTASMQTQIEAL